MTTTKPKQKRYFTLVPVSHTLLVYTKIVETLLISYHNVHYI